MDKKFSLGRHALLWFCSALALSGCGGGSSTDSSATTTTYTIGGAVGGLTGTVILQLNGGATLSVSANGNFVFPTAVASGSSYTVAVLTQPSNQVCAAGGDAAGYAQANVTTVSISCAAPTYTVGGTLTGLSGTLVLANNGGNNLTLSADGPFQFTTGVTSFQSYAVTVATQPAGQTCWVLYAAGVSSSAISNVQVNCAATTTTATISGGVNGLTSAGLVLILARNGVSTESLPALAVGSTSFAFATALTTGDNWVVGVGTQPSSPKQVCTVNNASGYIASASVNNVQVSCLTNQYSLGGSIDATGGLASGLVLQNNLGDDLAVPAAATSFTFATQLTSPSYYSVSVKQQPVGQTCTLSRAQGLVVAVGNITTVALSCVANSMAVPLNGTYGVSIAGQPLRGYLSFFADGTYVYGLHQASAQTCNTGTSSTNGNGVEYGVYNWNSATGDFHVVTAAVDTDDKCGLAAGSQLASGTLSKGAGGILTGTLTLPSGGGAVTLTPVASASGQLLGAWTTNGLGFVVYGSDNTIFAVNSQERQNLPTLNAGIEDGCLSGAAVSTASGGYTVNLGSGCSVASGLSAVDTNGSGGLSAGVGVTTSFAVSADSLTTTLGNNAPVPATRITVN